VLGSIPSGPTRESPSEKILKGIFVFYLQRPATAGRPACRRQAQRMFPQLWPKTKNGKSMQAIELQVFGIPNYSFVV